MAKNTVLYCTTTSVCSVCSIISLFWWNTIIGWVTIATMMLIGFQTGIDMPLKGEIRPEKQPLKFIGIVFLIVLVIGMLRAYYTVASHDLAASAELHVKIAISLSLFGACYSIPALIGKWARRFSGLRKQMKFST